MEPQFICPSGLCLVWGNRKKAVSWLRVRARPTERQHLKPPAPSGGTWQWSRHWLCRQVSEPQGCPSGQSPGRERRERRRYLTMFTQGRTKAVGLIHPEPCRWDGDETPSQSEQGVAENTHPHLSHSKSSKVLWSGTWVFLLNSWTRDVHWCGSQFSQQTFRNFIY